MRLGLTTAMGNPASDNATASSVSYPPVLSMTINAGVHAVREVIQALMPTGVWSNRWCFSVARLYRSKNCLATSIPTYVFMAFSRPCRCGLMGVPCPRRLFGLLPKEATSDPATSGLVVAPGRDDLDAASRSLAAAKDREFSLIEWFDTMSVPKIQGRVRNEAERSEKLDHNLSAFSPRQGRGSEPGGV